jgi:translation initiation factor 4A
METETIINAKNEENEENENYEEKNSKEVTDEFPIIQTWDAYDIKPELLRGIYAYGFEIPSEIQKRGILPILSKRDVLAQAQSGSGKTGTFSVGTLQNINVSVQTTQAIILAPTHELAKQICNVITSLGNFMEGLTVKTMLGGTSIQQDAAELREKPPHIIVGCSGRIYDMIVRKYLKVSHVKMLVLDEADEMLSKGFKDQIYNIFQHLDPKVQMILFSATMPEDILKLSERIMRQPVKITMKKEELNLECIKQFFVALQDDLNKYETLKDLFSVISVNQCIIYCNNVKRVIDLQTAMTNDGYSVCSIHSSMDKAERERVFAGFKVGSYRVLISSDITARGIDVQQVSTVINFDIPKCVHTYLHRIGRSGRWGRKGLAINFITRNDVFTLKKIESHYKINIEELPASIKDV